VLVVVVDEEIELATRINEFNVVIVLLDRTRNTKAIYRKWVYVIYCAMERDRMVPFMQSFIFIGDHALSSYVIHYLY